MREVLDHMRQPTKALNAQTPRPTGADPRGATHGEIAGQTSCRGTGGVTPRSDVPPRGRIETHHGHTWFPASRRAETKQCRGQLATPSPLCVPPDGGTASRRTTLTAVLRYQSQPVLVCMTVVPPSLSSRPMSSDNRDWAVCPICQVGLPDFAPRLHLGLSRLRPGRSTAAAWHAPPPQHTKTFVA